MDLNWFAERNLSNGGKSLRVRVAVPVWMEHPEDWDPPSGDHPNWVCHYEIATDEASERFTTRGSDSWMAVMNALAGANAEVEERFPNASWDGFEHPGMYIKSLVVFRSRSLQRELEARLMEAYFKIRRELGSWED